MGKPTKTCPYVKNNIHGRMRVNNTCDLRLKESRLAFMICQLVLEYFQLQLSDILFFSGGLRPFWDFLAFERPDGLSQAKKSQKGLRPPEKTKCLQASAENTPKKVDSS